MYICGNCLHDKEAHSNCEICINRGHYQHEDLDGFNFMYCAICMKLCDIEDYNTIHPFSGIIINDLKRIDIHE